MAFGEKPAQITTTSPLHQEDGVAITRETIIRFTKPLDPQSVSANDFVATFGGQALARRVHVSPDGRRVTVFYEETLPASSRVTVEVRGDGILDDFGLAVDADGDGIPGGEYRFSFSTLNLSVVPGTAVCGRVFASELQTAAAGRGASVNNPLPGVTITVDGMEDTLRTVTDENGDFRLEDVPAGRFFVHIDGRTSTAAPAGGFYPFVGKAWESVAGIEVNIGEVYLPLVVDGTLRPVSEEEETEVMFPDQVVTENPEFAGVMLRVPPDSLFSDDGTRGGSVGIAPVPPDRLPGELPPGLEFPLVITVQTDGATNFDVPAPIMFPNLPDPETGETLPPGAKSALWSFDHDKGRFEIVGSMTVTPDGTMVATDPGVGILAPGWHGVNPGSIPGPFDPSRLNCFGSGCGGALAWGAVDCAVSFLPIAGSAACGFNVAYGAATVARDCSSGAGVGCGITAAAGVGGSIAGCASRSIPGLGQTIACGGALLGILDACGCDGRRGVESEIVQFGAYLDMLQAHADLFTLMLGSDVWVNAVDPSMGDPREEVDEVNDIINALVEATGSDTPEQDLITEDEAIPIRALPHPDTITLEDIDSAIDYLNQTTIEWRAGNETHAEAGRTDFIDYEEYQMLVDAVEDSIRVFQDVTGSAGTDPLSFSQPIIDAVEEMAQSSGIPGSESDPGTLLYVLEDMTNGFVQRGNLTDDGLFELRTLRADTYYRAGFLNPAELTYAQRTFLSSAAGSTSTIPAGLLYSTAEEPDQDDDGLADVAEWVVGTIADDPDTDDDGILDGAEVQQGLDPLGGLNAVTGTIAAVETPGEAVAIDAFDDLAAVAELEDGVSIFNVFNGMDPLIVAQVDTEGSAQDVAISGDYVAVADGSNGLVVIDISDPPEATVLYETALVGDVTTVAAAAGVAYAGTSNGFFAVVELSTGTVVKETVFGETIEDIGIAGNIAGILADDGLHLLTTVDLGLISLGDLPLTGDPAPSQNGRTLFMGSDLAYVGSSDGYRTIDLSDPANPEVIGSPAIPQPAFYDIAVNGSGLVVSTTSVAGLPRLAVSIYDGSDPTDTTTLFAEFDTTGGPRDLSIYNGLAYIAAGDGGLLVFNYLAFDGMGMAPEIDLAATFSLDPPQAEEGKSVRVTANVTDDVQVRNVELYLDGTKAQTDGNYPFEFRFVMPLQSEQTSLLLRARASDTGGNAMWTDEITVAITEDIFPPEVILTSPLDGGIRAAGFPLTLSATFNEPVDPATLTPTSFVLVSDSGGRGVVGGGSVAYLEEINTAFLDIESGVPVGMYRAELRSPLADLAGNALTAPITWTIDVRDQIDVTFINPSGGFWSDPSNWDPFIVPRSQDRALINSPVLEFPLITLDIDAEIAGMIVGNETASPFIRGNGVTLTLRGASELRNFSILALAEGALLGPGPLEVLESNLALTNCDVTIELINEGTVEVVGSTMFEGPVTTLTDSLLFVSSNALNPNVVIEFLDTFDFSGSLKIENNGDTLEFRHPGGPLTIGRREFLTIEGGFGEDQMATLDAQLVNNETVVLQGNVTITSANPTHSSTKDFIFGEGNARFVLGETGTFRNTGSMTTGSTETARLIMDGGTLINEEQGTIQGFGTYEVTGNPLQNAGRIRPTSAVATDFLRIDGDLEQMETGQIQFELNSFDGSTVTQTRLEVTGNATLGGTLLVQVSVPTAPPLGTQVELATFGSRTGEFSVEDVGTVAAEGVALRVYYTDTSVGVVFVAAP